MQPSPEKLQKARAEIALLSLLGLLLIPVALSLFLAEIRIDPRALAAMIVGIGFILPALALRGFLAGRPLAGLVFTALAAAAPAFVATGQIWIAAVALVCGAAGARLYYHIRDNTTYRPRLRGE